MPTWRGEEFLERVLAALASQELALPWDFLAIDSGSDDGTLAILERHARDFPVPLRVRSIPTPSPTACLILTSCTMAFRFW